MCVQKLGVLDELGDLVGEHLHLLIQHRDFLSTIDSVKAASSLLFLPLCFIENACLTCWVAWKGTHLAEVLVHG